MKFTASLFYLNFDNIISLACSLVEFTVNVTQLFSSRSTTKPALTDHYMKYFTVSVVNVEFDIQNAANQNRCYFRREDIQRVFKVQIDNVRSISIDYAMSCVQSFVEV